MYRSSTARRRSSSNPGRMSQQNTKSKEDSQIPKPRIRSSSTDRSSGMRKSNLKFTTVGKQPVGQFATGSSGTSPMPSNRYTHTIEKSSRPSLMDQANRGRSIDPSQKGVTPKTSSSRHLPPMNDGKNVRASSAERASALVSKVTSKKDNRPLSDKNFQQEMWDKIEGFFDNIRQSSILHNSGGHKPLTLKIFVEATLLLIKLLDIKPTLTMANYIDEIQKIAKKLHYPGQMSKSWLQTANTMHSWPHAIGWLSWLVELCEAKDLASEIFTLDRLPMIGDSESEIENRRNMFNTMIQCYKVWNDEKPEEEERLIREYFEKEAERRGISEQSQRKVSLEYEKAQEDLQKELAELDKVDEELNKLQQTLSNLKKDNAQKDENIIEQQKKIEKYQREMEHVAKDSLKFTEDIEKFQITIEELKKTINKQPMSVAERDEIIKACSEERSYIQNFESHLEEIRKEAYSLDMRLVSTNRNLEKGILDYNKELIIQFSGSGEDYNNFSLPERGFCEEDFMDRLKDKKALINSFLKDRSKELSSKAMELESLDREIEAMQTKKDVLSEKVEKKKATEQKKKQDIKAQEEIKREDIKKLQMKMDDVNEEIKKISEEIEALDKQLPDIVDKKEAVLRKNARLKESGKIFFEQFFGILDDNRGKCKDLLEKFLKDGSK